MFLAGIAAVAAGATYYYRSQCEPPQLICKDTELSHYIKTTCPVTTDTYYPTPLFMNNHISTSVSALFTPNPQIPYRKENFTCDDGGVLTLDWLDNFSSKPVAEDTRPILVVLHGLTGSSEANYVKCIALAAWQSAMHVVILNNRGSPGSPPLKTPMTFSAAYTGDLRQVIAHIQTVQPHSPIFAVGVSLGSIILSKYLAECGASCPIKAAMAISNPFNLVKSTESLERFTSRLLYNGTLAKNLISIVNLNAAVFANDSRIDLERVRSSKTIRQFDESFIVPMFGYKDVEEYYHDASTCYRIKDIRVPLLIVNAADDPFAPIDGLPQDVVKESDSVIVMLTKRGGHVAFTEGLIPFQDSMMARTVKQYFKSMMGYSNRHIAEHMVSSLIAEQQHRIEQSNE